MNTAPVILNMTINSNTSYNFTVGGIWQFLIPPIYDSEQNSEFLLTLSQNPTKQTKLPYFMEFDSTKQLISLNPKSPADAGSYNFYVRIQEVDAPSYFT
jgi:hypothetical protein